MATNNLIGIGLYTAADASRLLGIPAPRLVRWLKGYTHEGRDYAPLWKSQIDLGDMRIYLGFRDMMEARVANKFIQMGVAAQHIRETIRSARDVLGSDRPLSTNQFRTDGQSIFLRIIATDADGRERERLLNLFKKQYEFSSVINPLLKDVEFDPQGAPSAWWPAGRAGKILIDPGRAFGQPIDAQSSVPVTILAHNGKRQGIDATARAYDVPKASVRRAMEFMGATELRRAA